MNLSTHILEFPPLLLSLLRSQADVRSRCESPLVTVPFRTRGGGGGGSGDWFDGKKKGGTSLRGEGVGGMTGGEGGGGREWSGRGSFGKKRTAYEISG